MKFLLSIIVLTITSPAFANGEKAGNGGLTVSCYQTNYTNHGEVVDVNVATFIKKFGQARLEERILPGYPITLDYYDASLPKVSGGKSLLEPIAELSYLDTLARLRKKIEYYPTFAYRLNQLSTLLNDVPDWKDADLSQIDDSNKAYRLPQNCISRTAALRQGDTAQDGVVYGDGKEIRKLSPSQQALLKLHEDIYFHATVHAGQQDSRSTRLVIEQLLQLNTDQQELTRVLKLIGANISTTDNWKEVGRIFGKLQENFCAIPFSQDNRAAHHQVSAEFVYRWNYLKNKYGENNKETDTLAGCIGKWKTIAVGFPNDEEYKEFCAIDFKNLAPGKF